MFNLQATERCLALLLEKHYLQDPSIRHDPLYQDVDRLHQQVREAVDQEQDAEEGDGRHGSNCNTA
mgnify:CR=1 FL=1